MRLLSEGTKLIAGVYGKSHILPQELVLRRVLLIGLLTAVPAVLFAWGGEPVSLLALAGSIEALQLPIAAALVLFLNRTRLPATLRPGPLAMAGTTLATLFFGLFAILLLGQMRSGGE